MATNKPARETEALCAAGRAEDDEGAVFCACPFFWWDDGERFCREPLSSYDPLLSLSHGTIDMTEMTRQEVLAVCPLKKENVLVRLKEEHVEVDTEGE